MSRRTPRSTEPFRLAVVTVGEELLNGFVVDTNAAWLGRRLATIGVRVVGRRTVGDDEAAIVAAIREGLSSADGVLVSGGLGPTSDDRTRAALAMVADAPLRRDERAEAALRERLTAQGREAGPQHLTQVDIPEGAIALPNPAGTAPGIRLLIDGHPVYAVPGPPHEMEAVVDGSVVPDLLRRRRTVVLTRSLRTALIPESEVASIIAPLETAHPDVSVAYLAAPGEVVVRLTSRGTDERAVMALVDAASEDAREALGDAVVGEASQTLAQAVVGLLANAGRTVAVAESLTGGGVASAITDVPGASAVLRGGLVAYTVDAKRDVLGVDAALLAEHGPVHAGVARSMAERARALFDADLGLATTGVAGPDPQGGRPVGTVHIAVAGAQSTLDVPLLLHGDRAMIRRQSVVHALDLVRRVVLGLPPRRGPVSD